MIWNLVSAAFDIANRVLTRIGCKRWSDVAEESSHPPFHYAMPINIMRAVYVRANDPAFGVSHVENVLVYIM